MNAKLVARILFGIVLTIGSAPAYLAQDASSQQQAEQRDKDKPTPEKKALLLLEQVVGEAGALKLPENRDWLPISSS